MSANVISRLIFRVCWLRVKKKTESKTDKGTAYNDSPITRIFKLISTHMRLISLLVIENALQCCNYQLKLIFIAL